MPRAQLFALAHVLHLRHGAASGGARMSNESIFGRKAQYDWLARFMRELTAASCNVETLLPVEFIEGYLIPELSTKLQLDNPNFDSDLFLLNCKPTTTTDLKRETD